jgi:hypothetical protein
MEYLIFFSIVAIVGGAIWYVTNKFLKNEAVLIAESTKKELYKFKEEVVADVIKVEEAVITKVRAVKTKKKATK